jgi:hypothetical protein
MLLPDCAALTSDMKVQCCAVIGHKVVIMDSMRFIQDNVALKLEKLVLKSGTIDYPGKGCPQLGNTMLILDASPLIPGYAALTSDI